MLSFSRFILFWQWFCTMTGIVVYMVLIIIAWSFRCKLTSAPPWNVLVGLLADFFIMLLVASGMSWLRFLVLVNPNLFLLELLYNLYYLKLLWSLSSDITLWFKSTVSSSCCFPSLVGIRSSILSLFSLAYYNSLINLFF